MIVGTFRDQDSGATITVSWEFVTPQIAKEWISRNTALNRHLNMSDVEKISNDISTGYWMFNGSTVCFDWDDVMLDARLVQNTGIKLKSISDMTKAHNGKPLFL